MQLLSKKKYQLNEGDTIGLITPSSPISDEQLKTAVKNMENAGLKCEYLPSITDRAGFFAGCPEKRAEELHNMFKREDIKAVLAVRGGYGSFGMLELLDYDLLNKYSKPLIGYSDVTALLSAILQRADIPLIHGPMALTGFSDYTLTQFKKLMFSGGKKITINSIESKNSDSVFDSYVINSGKTKGTLLGGNLSVLVSLIGTSYDPDYKGKILFLEEINEAPYKIHRMLKQMQFSGKFADLRGIVLGVFNGCDNETDEEKAENYSLKEVITEIITPLNIPAVYGFSFGHVEDKASFPVGVDAEFDADLFRLTIDLP